MPRDPIGDSIRNLLRLERLGTAISREAEPVIRDLFDDIAAEIARLDPLSPPQETYRRLRLEKLIGSVEDLVGESFEEVGRRIRQRVAEVGKAQSAAALGILESSLGGVAVDLQPGGVGINMAKAILDADPFQGETLAGWVESQELATVRRVRRQIQVGMSRGETLDDIIRRVRGKQAGFIRKDPDTGLFVAKGTRGADIRPRFVGGVLNATTRDTEAIVRTAINFISNRAAVDTFGQNADVLTELVVTATLDGKTTEICIAKDGLTTDPADPDPNLVPPFHYQCRTILTPRVAWDRLGIEPPPEGTRASADGQVPSSTTYEDWFRDQSAAFQNEVVGPTRARLFREGKINLRQLIREDNSIVPVDELLAAA